MTFFEAVINNLDEAIFLFDKKGRLIFSNKAAEEFSGRSHRELKHAPFRKLFHGAKDIISLLQKSITEGRSFNCRDMEVDIGRAANINVNISPFYPGDSLEGALLCIRENLSITNREDYRFDMLLYLIGSVAHEIKNPLSGIKGAAQILKASTKNPEAEECVGLILKEADRLNLVLHSYLTMTRTPVFNYLNVHEVIEHSLKVMETSIKEKKIVIEKSYDPSLPAIRGDESKLLQVFINLLKNAIEAVGARKIRAQKNGCMKKPSGRVLSISTRPSDEYVVIYEDRAHDRKTPKTKKQRWVAINIKDTGVGIPSGELEKIFLPFYTRKEGGSGLGLALSKKIINDHGGIIKVKSKAGCGTTVSIYLPLQVNKDTVNE